MCVWVLFVARKHFLPAIHADHTELHCAGLSIDCQAVQRGREGKKSLLHKTHVLCRTSEKSESKKGRAKKEKGEIRVNAPQLEQRQREVGLAFFWLLILYGNVLKKRGFPCTYGPDVLLYFYGNCSRRDEFNLSLLQSTTWRSSLIQLKVIGGWF